MKIDLESSINEWPRVRLGDICHIEIGGTPRRSERRYWTNKQRGFPWASIADLRGRNVQDTGEYISPEGVDNSSTKLAPKGTLLMSFKLTLGRVAFAGTDLYTNEAIAHFYPSSSLSSQWLYYALPSIAESETAEQAIKGKTLNKGKLNNLCFPLPPIEEQRRIANVLDTVDAAIRETDSVIAKQEQVKAGLLQDLLTRGLDANGRLRDPEANPGAFRETETARVPEDWSIRPLREVADIGSGLTINRSRTKENPVKIPYLRVANVQDGYLDLEKVKTVEVSASKVSRYLLQEGDVLMTEGGDFDKLGRGTVWEGQVKPCAHQNHIFRVRTDRSALLPHFLSALSGSSYGKRYFIRNSKQTTNLATINQSQLKRFPVLCPPIEEQRQIVGRLSDFEKLLIDARAYQVKLQRLKTGLMQDLLTGRVRVPEAEAHINKVIT